MASPAPDGSVALQPAPTRFSDTLKAQKRLAGGLPTLQARKKSRGIKKRVWTWDFVHEDSKDKDKWRCQFCDSHFAKDNITRFKQHLLNPRACKFLNSKEAAALDEADVVEARQAVAQKTASQSSVYKTNSNKSGLMNVRFLQYACTTTVIKHGTTFCDGTGYVDRVSTADHNELVEAFATWLYMSAIPFWIVEQQVKAQISLHCLLYTMLK